MLRKLFLLVATAATLAASGLQSLQAAVVMSIEPSISFEEGSGNRPVNLLVRTTAAESVIAITADFTIGNGAGFSNPPGVFGSPGFVGAGNLAGSTLFVRGAGNNPLVANLSLDFSADQPLPGADSPIATFNIDITGLAPGFYPINFTGTTADSSVLPLQSSGVNGGFTILAAIPEPTSMLLLGVSISSLAIARRRRTVAA